MNTSNAINVLTSIPSNANDRINACEVGILKSNDKNIQCNLLQTPFYSELRSFRIENKNERKFLLRAIFAWIIFQHILYLPFMYLSIKCVSSKISKSVDSLEILCAIDLTISALFYYFRNFRRSMKNSYLSLIFVTIINTVSMGIYANAINNLIVLLHPVIVILQLSSIVLFTLQSKFDPTYFGVVVIILPVYIIFLNLNIFIFHNTDFYIISTFSLLFTVYITFDIQLILTSPLHAYNMKANEHVFGAVNLFADLSKLAWLLFKFFFSDSLILTCRVILKSITYKFY